VKTSEPIIMPDSPEAATYRTDIKGWVSRDGTFYGDGPNNERTARYAGSTRSYCKQCNAAASKSWTLCDACKDAKAREEYGALPKVKWDGFSMVYSQALDRYFNEPGNALDEMDEDLAVEDLQMFACKPNYVSPLDHEYCSDDLPEDIDEPPDEVLKAMEAFNQAVSGIVLSWSPGKQALDMTDYLPATTQESSHE
jgi:hypothetical protein